MTAVPDPRFRDQLAEALWLAQPEYIVSPWDEISELTRERYRAKADALMPTIAAEVKARVQAAANQRAAEDVVAADREEWIRAGNEEHAVARAAALASPAPAPRAEEGCRWGERRCSEPNALCLVDCARAAALEAGAGS